ncbi:MAG: transglutaminase domain-containing protein [Nitrospinae bacterium]|nr:transglutaminase domain-containing protein [Nitrospinota bacterium]
MKIIIKLTLLILLFTPALSDANTFYLDGEIFSDINMEIAKEIKIPQGVKSFSVYIGQIQSFSSPTFNQQILSFNNKYSTTPSNIEDKIDENGNKYLIARWENPPSELNINTVFKVKSKVAFSDLKSKSSFPVSNISPDIKKYLSDSQYAQKNDPSIVSLSKKLTEGAKTQYEAVTNVLNWVVDNMKYTLEPPQYDALYSLKTGTGNCQNFSNLSVSLLRVAGIPARVVIGFTVKNNWKVKHINDGSTRTLSLADGRHAWFEVYYPDIGWVEYDAQQTLTFVSTRYIRQGVGVDSKEVSDGIYKWSWLQKSNESPSVKEAINATFENDKNEVQSGKFASNPKNHLFGILLAAVKEEIPAPVLKKGEAKPIPKPEIPPPPPPKPELPPPPPEKKEWGDLTKLKYTKSAEFGNLNFPEVIDIFAEYKKKETAATATDVSMSSSFVVESAEYVTDKEVFAQSFELNTPMMIKDISLAMHKFGGTHGDLWIEIVEDKNGSPTGDKIESDRIPINNIKYFNGYKWIPFSLERQKIILSPARYWAVLRYSGDAIFNWFYIYGNPYGIPDDTKSKMPEGSDWNNILSYDFNFRVRGTEPE